VGNEIADGSRIISLVFITAAAGYTTSVCTSTNTPAFFAHLSLIPHSPEHTSQTRSPIISFKYYNHSSFVQHFTASLSGLDEVTSNKITLLYKPLPAPPVDTRPVPRTCGCDQVFSARLATDRATLGPTGWTLVSLQQYSLHIRLGLENSFGTNLTLGILRVQMATSHFVLVASIYAPTVICSTIPPRADSNQQPASTPHWSTEAILSLCAIFVALLCCIAGLAAPKFWQLVSRGMPKSDALCQDLPYADPAASTLEFSLNDRNERGMDAVEGRHSKDAAGGVHEST
jgi:hypothetical protein